MNERTENLPMRQEFGASQELPIVETASSAVAAQAKAMVESRYIMAMRNPRNPDQVRQDLLRECRRPAFANNKSAFYRKPIGAGVEGLGIRFVEVALRCMKNVLIETSMIFEDTNKEVHRVSVTDLESNVTYPLDVRVSKTVERSKPMDDGSYISVRKNSYGKDVYILDYGHEVEALARPIAEEIIGDDLFPVTYSYGRMSASCDGLTMDDTTAFEHKQWSEKLSASVSLEELPDEYKPQCQQVMYVTGAERLLFMVSNGTKEQCVWMWVYPDPEWIKRIIAGWKQFDTDLFNFVPVEVIPAAVAAPTLDLPAVSIQTTGQIAIRSNLRVFGEALQGFIERLPTKPSTDQEFADCKAALAKLKTAEECLESEEVRALSQMAEIDEMRREKKFLQDLARTTRLALGTLVTQREAAIKQEIVQEGKDKLADHIAQLNKRLGRVQMPAVSADFAGAIKSKRTVESLRNAVDTCLANAKIAANEIADKISINLTTLDEHKDHAFLFSDLASLAMKANDDLINVMKLRISEHQAEQQKKLDDEREKIRKEEQDRADREAADKLADAQREAAEKAEAERKEQERIAAAASPAPVVVQVVQPVDDKTVSAQAIEPVQMQASAPAPALHAVEAPAAVKPDTAWKIAGLVSDMEEIERVRVLQFCERIIEQRAQAAA